jgi:hypothetical protein
MEPELRRRSMTPDPFASPMISQILTWVFSIPLICGIIAWAVSVLFEKQEDLPRIFTIWLLICLLLFSPVRYIMLQLLAATAYPFQSIAGFLRSFILAMYVPIVFGLLYAIGLGVPVMLTILIAGKKQTPAKGRLFIAGILAPVIFLVFSTIYYNILPYAAYSTHWLGPKELIRTSNGPSQYFYRFAVEPFTPLQFSRFAYDIGLENMSGKERLRAHIATIYCGNKQHWYYVSKAYPKYFKTLKQEPK